MKTLRRLGDGMLSAQSKLLPPPAILSEIKLGAL